MRKMSAHEGPSTKADKPCDCYQVDLTASNPVWKSKFYGAFTPSTRRLLDGVVMPVPHRSTECTRHTG